MKPVYLIRLAPVAILAAFAFALLGCSAEVSVGGDDQASGEELAEDIERDYESQTGIELRALTCEGVEADEGAEFECSGRNARGVQLEIAGEVTETEADGFDYTWEVVRGVAPGVLYERALRRQLESRGIALVEVRCPVEVEIEVGAEVRCTASDREGSSRGVTLTLTDRDGGFDYAVDGHGGEADGHGAPEEGGGAPSTGTQS